MSVDASRGGKGVSANAEESEGTVREKQKSLSTPWIHQKKFQRRRPKEEDVKEERETSPRSSSISSRMWKRKKSKDFRIGDRGSPKTCFTMCHGDKAKAKAKAMAEKETKGSCSRSVRPGVKQGFHKHIVVNFDTGAAGPQFPERTLKGT